MYITQYDIELLLLVNPSTMIRSDKEKTLYEHILATCIKYGNNNKCGQKMSELDPCLSDMMLRRFPQIDGYIGIAEQDANLFNKKYQEMIEKYGEMEKIKQILPSIISNSRGAIGISEIVIHPLRCRYDNCYLITENLYSPERIINYCIHNRAIYNFFPLLYFTNTDIFTINDLKSNSTIKKLAESVRIYNNSISNLFENIDKVFSKMLLDGYNIHSINYRVVVDTRTGFYRVYLDKLTNINTNRNTRKKVYRNFKDDTFQGYIDTYLIKQNNDPRLNTIISSHQNYIDNFLNDLNTNGYAMKKKLVFNRGDSKSFIYKYYLDKVFERPELNKYRNRRHRKKNITNKRAKNFLSSILQFNGLDLKNLDEISSIDEYINNEHDNKKNLI